MWYLCFYTRLLLLNTTCAMSCHAVDDTSPSCKGSGFHLLTHCVPFMHSSVAGSGWIPLLWLSGGGCCSVRVCALPLKLPLSPLGIIAQQWSCWGHRSSLLLSSVAALTGCLGSCFHPLMPELVIFCLFDNNHLCR